MFSATEPLASAPLATVGTTKLVNGSAALVAKAQVLAGTGARRKRQTGSAALRSPAQTIAGLSRRIKIIYTSAALTEAAQRLSGFALYTRVVRGSAALSNPPQVIQAICYVVRVQDGSAALVAAPQVIEATATRLMTKSGSAALVSAAHDLNGYGTRIRIQTGSGTLVAAPAILYGSEITPIRIKVDRAPLNLYEVALRKTDEPYTTVNHYLTVFQVPGYLELQPDGTFVERKITAIITACSAVTADLTTQPISLIVIQAEGVVVFPLFPSKDVVPGQLNVMPLRDFNLVTDDVIQIKCLGEGDVTITLSMLLNTQAN